MSLQRNYYEVLGIPPEATSDQIKKKYRELARKFHPDVVQDKALGQRVFSQINQAYHVLGDPQRRAKYNTSLSSGTNGSNGVTVAGTSSSAHTVRVTPQSRPATGRQSAESPKDAAPTGMAQKAMAVSRLLSDADNAIMAGKPIEARAFCVKVLEIDTRNARALELLGDALEQLGRREEAADQYRSALKVAPSSLIQAKLNRLEQTVATPVATSPRSNTTQDNGDKPGKLFGRFLGRK